MSLTNVILLIVISSVVVSLSPLTISVFLALSAGALGKGHSNKRYTLTSLLFLGTFTTILAVLGFTLMRVFNLMSVDLLSSISITVAVAAIIFGLVSVKDYFWYDKRIKIPAEIYDLLHNKTMKQDNPYGSINLGAITAFASLANIGILLLSLSAILALSGQGDDLLMLLPALCFSLPLAIIFILVTRSTKISALIKWKEDSKPAMRLETGLMHIILAWILLLMLNGSIGSIL
jgi:cytochrome c biogenesis protein CcdA